MFLKYVNAKSKRKHSTVIDLFIDLFRMHLAEP